MKPAITKSTMKDVSSAAGVSVATVSHVLNNTKYVTENMRKKVLDAVEILNYKPNISARNFKMGKRQTIGFVVPDISNIFFSTLINEVEVVVAKQDYLLFVVNTQENPEVEKRQLQRLTSGLVDGLIVASAFDNYNTIKHIIPNQFPVVFLDRKLRHCRCDTIVISNYNAVYKGVANLIQRGHHKIGCITGFQHLSTLDERIHAYRNCLRDHHIEPDKSRILEVDVTKKIDIADLAQFFARDITAAIFLNNTITVDAFVYLTNNNIVLNRDLDAVGYSDNGWHHYAVRYMDIITQPLADMGNIAGARILDRIANPDMQANEFVLEAGYVPRG
jgi:LacI family transcriptional regulator